MGPNLLADYRSIMVGLDPTLGLKPGRATLAVKGPDLHQWLGQDRVVVSGSLAI